MAKMKQWNWRSYQSTCYDFIRISCLAKFIYYFSTQKDDIINCFMLFAIFRCLELSLFICCLLWNLLEPFKKAEEFEFGFRIEVEFELIYPEGKKRDQQD